MLIVPSDWTKGRHLIYSQKIHWLSMSQSDWVCFQIQGQREMLLMEPRRASGCLDD